MADKLCSVIILSWNGGDDVLGCVEHVLRQTYKAVELIIIDNGSGDSSPETIETRFPSLRVFRNPENRGYAAGMNQGIALAKGEYILLLNQDAWIHDDFIERSVGLMESSSDDIGMVAGKVYKLKNGHKTEILLGGALKLNMRLQFVGDADVSTRHETFSPMFCSPIIKRAALQDILEKSGHVFDDKYFAYGEDLDLVLRAHIFGWRCAFSPDVVLWHAHSGSQQGRIRLWEKDLPIIQHAIRNRHSTMIKDIPLGILIRLFPHLLFSEIMLWPFLAVKNPSSIVYLIRAYRESLLNLPDTIRLRRIILGHRVVSNRDLWGYFAA